MATHWHQGITRMITSLGKTEVEVGDSERAEEEEEAEEEVAGAIGMISRGKDTETTRREAKRNGKTKGPPSTGIKGQAKVDGGMPCHCSLHTHPLHSNSLLNPNILKHSRPSHHITNSDHSFTKHHNTLHTDCSHSSP